MLSTYLCNSLYWYRACYFAMFTSTMHVNELIFITITMFSTNIISSYIDNNTTHDMLLTSYCLEMLAPCSLRFLQEIFNGEP